MRILGFIMAVLLPTAAAAQTVAIWVEGHEPAALRQGLRAGLEKSGVELVPDDAFADVLDAVGIGEIGDRGVKALATSLAQAAEGVNANAIVLVRVQKPRGKKQLAEFRLVDANGVQFAEGRPVVAKSKGKKKRRRFKVSFKALVKEVTRALGDLATEEVAAAESGTETAVSSEATSETAAVESADGSEAGGGSSSDGGASGGSGEGASVSKTAADDGDDEPMDEDAYSFGDGVVATALGVLEFSYSSVGRYHIYDNLAAPGLRGYGGFGVPGFRIGLQLFPFAAMSEVPALHDFGVGGGFSMPISLRSKVTLDNGTEVVFNTDAYDWEADVIYRVDVRPVMIFFNAGLGQLVFDFGAVGVSEGMPGVSYLTVRGGLTIGLDFGYVRFFIGTSYTHPLAAGAVTDEYYPGASAIGFDSRFGFDIRLYAGFGLYAGLRHRVFVYNVGNATPRLGASAVDGITDHHVAVDSGLRWVF